MGELCQFKDTRVVREASNIEIRAVDFKDHRGLRSDRLGVILKVGFISSAHLNEFSSRCFEYFRNTEAATDFNQLTAGDNHFVFLALAKMT